MTQVVVLKILSVCDNSCFSYSALVNGKSLSIRPTKVVAGHEPEKTNEFLQALANAISKKVGIVLLLFPCVVYLQLLRCLLPIDTLQKIVIVIF